MPFTALASLFGRLEYVVITVLPSLRAACTTARSVKIVIPEQAVVLRPPADLGLRGLSGGLDEGQHVLWVGDHRDVVRRHLDGGGAHAGGELALGFGRDGLIAGGDEEPRRP